MIFYLSLFFLIYFYSYTLECNYNMSRVGNEITACETDPKGSHVLPVSTYDTSPAPYTPSCYAGKKTTHTAHDTAYTTHIMFCILT